MENKELSAEDFILQEKVTGSDCPYLRASDFPREIVHELMEEYANYKVNLKMQEIQLISGN